MLAAMRAARYHQQQRSHWINEALLCEIFMRLDGPCTRALSFNDTSVARWVHLRVTVPHVLDRFVMRCLQPSLSDQPSVLRGQYSRAVRIAIQARLDCPVELPHPPGTFTREMLRPESQAHAIAIRLDDCVILRGLARRHVDIAARSFVRYRDTFSEAFDPIEAWDLARAQDEFDVPTRTESVLAGDGADSEALICAWD